LVRQIKNSVESFINRLDQVEDRISRLEDKVDELEYSNNDKFFKKYKWNIQTSGALFKKQT
jgi:uncharacterized protein Yka (UPF0111/DUF47 family)